MRRSKDRGCLVFSATCVFPERQSLTINDGDVDIPEKADGFLDCHDKWPAEVDFHQFQEWQSLVVATPIALLSCLLPQLLRLPLEYRGCVGLS